MYVFTRERKKKKKEITLWRWRTKREREKEEINEPFGGGDFKVGEKFGPSLISPSYLGVDKKPWNPTRPTNLVDPFARPPTRP